MNRKPSSSRGQHVRSEITKIFVSAFLLAVYVLYIFPNLKPSFYSTLIWIFGFLVIGFALSRFLVKGELKYLVIAGVVAALVGASLLVVS